MNNNATPADRRIGFVSTRFAGNDGVSLETEKWIHVLERMNCSCFFMAGESEWDSGRSRVVPEAHFKHPDINMIHQIAFNQRTRPEETTRQIHRIKDYLKEQLRLFVREFSIEVLVVENALSIPLNIPLGLALTEFIAETGLLTIAHHHDFFWERKRFLVNCVWDYLNMAFPPHLPQIRHVVINSSGANQLSLRTGISSLLIPNVMDFDNPPAPPDEYCDDVCDSLGVLENEWLFLQPTRVVPRKGIEHAIELARRIGKRAKLVVSHASGDEGHEYEIYLHEYAQLMGVQVNFVSDIIREKRGVIDGHKVYTLTDIYPKSDLVTYPSDIEGFGNAFLEAVYFMRPILVNNYSIFDTDIKPKGFEVIEFDGIITDRVVKQTINVLEDAAAAQQMCARNYELARSYYSYTMLARLLRIILADFFGENI